MSDARLTILVASSPAPARSPSVAFNLGSATGKNSWRPPARIIAVDQPVISRIWIELRDALKWSVRRSLSAARE